MNRECREYGEDTTAILITDIGDKSMQKSEAREPDEEWFISLFYRIEKYPDVIQSKRVERLVELFSELRDDISPSEKLRVTTRLRNALRRYTWTIQVVSTPEFSVRRVIADPTATSQHDLWEYGAVSRLLDAVPEPGHRPRIRRCDNCKTWMFAGKRTDQRFCSASCKQKAHESDPEKREKKLAHMREAYALGKERDRKAKERIGLNGKSRVSANLKVARAIKPAKKSR
jgi:hypothetical protein